MNDATILLDKRAGYWLITLNRPKALNSFNRAMRAELMAILTDAAKDEACRALLITGAGRGFCAGQDLADGISDPNAATPDLGALLEAEYNPMVKLMRSMDKPIVAAVNGVAAGGGANFALACDIVIAGRAAKFLQAFVHIGLLPDVGGTWFLPRLAGEARAKGLAMLGEPLPAEKAEQWGMIWRCVDDAVLLTEAEALTARLAALPTQAIAMMKRAFLASETNTLEQQLGLERVLQRDAGYSPDSREGVRAFLEKRPATFTGRKA